MSQTKISVGLPCFIPCLQYLVNFSGLCFCKYLIHWTLVWCYNLYLPFTITIPILQRITNFHYTDVDKGVSQITSLTIVYSAVYAGGDQRKHQSSASLAFVWGIHRRPVNSSCKGPITRKIIPFDDVIMTNRFTFVNCHSQHWWVELCVLNIIHYFAYII